MRQWLLSSPYLVILAKRFTALQIKRVLAIFCLEVLGWLALILNPNSKWFSLAEYPLFFFFFLFFGCLFRVIKIKAQNLDTVVT